MRLFRPVGIEELRLIYRSGMRAFPPRLTEQPVFYPVLTMQYAEQIAREWNAKSETLAGYVTRFEIDDGYAQGFEPRKVGAKEHLEFWVPAEELPTFNSHIAGPILVVAAYFGAGFRGAVPDKFMLAGRTATEQLVTLSKVMDYSGMDFFLEVRTNSEALFLNYPFWHQGHVPDSVLPMSRQGQVLDALRRAWSDHFPTLPLPELSGVAA
jgi:hypothetical protein